MLSDIRNPDNWITVVVFAFVCPSEDEMNHTLEYFFLADGSHKCLAWKHWYNAAWADGADEHHRFAYRNGMIHVLVFGGSISREDAQTLVDRWIAGEITTFVFTTRHYARKR